jgi:phosphatidylserine synthase
VDGYVARRLDQASAFGAQLDGLADTINFCLYPAAVAYALGFDSWLMVAVLCVFLVCAVWRIAYFNVTGLQNEAGDSYFVGLPTPFVGACFLILASFSGLIPAKYLIPLMFAFFTSMSLLMSLSFLYAKNGTLTTGISILAPIAILFMWLYQ